MHIGPMSRTEIHISLQKEREILQGFDRDSFFSFEFEES